MASLITSSTTNRLKARITIADSAPGSQMPHSAVALGSGVEFFLLDVSSSLVIQHALNDEAGRSELNRSQLSLERIDDQHLSGLVAELQLS
jgi:hypothetical protein